MDYRENKHLCASVEGYLKSAYNNRGSILNMKYHWGDYIFLHVMYREQCGQKGILLDYSLNGKYHFNWLWEVSWEVQREVLLYIIDTMHEDLVAITYGELIS